MTSPATTSSPSTRQLGGEQPTSLPTDDLSSRDNPINNSTLPEQLKQQSKKAIHDFFYPQPQTPPQPTATTTETGQSSSSTASNDPNNPAGNDEENRLFVEQFWKYYDDIIILSLFTQLGILFRLAASRWFSIFDGTFRADSALFLNLPLNCLSTFLMGCLASGPDVMGIIETRFTPDRRHEEQEDESTGSNGDYQEEYENSMAGLSSSPRLDRLRRRKRNRIYHYRRKQGDAELREVQLLALERRIRASPSLLLFPVAKEEADLMEHYFAHGYKRNRNNYNDDATTSTPSNGMLESHEEANGEADNPDNPDDSGLQNVELASADESLPPPHATDAVDYGTTLDRDLDQIIFDVSTSFAGHVQGEVQNLSSNLNRLSKVTLVDGWDQGTTPEAMSEDLMLGLRDGFCGALSSFSSWNSSMVALIRGGDVQEAFVGYLLGLQLPIVAYRFGQHVAVYIFIWRCRREVRSDERRGYGIRISQNEHSLDLGDDDSADDMDSALAAVRAKKPARELPSVRAVATAIFVLALVAQITSLTFYNNPDNQLLALSLFFSPFGVLTRWRLSKYNAIKPGFPLGTFSCNLLACALHGSLGSLLAGNPGPRERIVLVAFISGFGGTLSSVASFVVEVLHGLDPLLFKLEGVYYATCTIFWGMMIGLISISSVDWADRVAQSHHHSSS